MQTRIEKDKKEIKNNTIHTDVAQAQGRLQYLNNRPEVIQTQRLKTFANSFSQQKNLNHPIQFTKGTSSVAKAASSAKKAKASYPPKLNNTIKRLVNKYNKQIPKIRVDDIVSEVHANGSARILGTRRVIRKWGSGYRTLLLKNLKGGKDIYGRVGKNNAVGTLPVGIYLKNKPAKFGSPGLVRGRQIKPGGFSPAKKRATNQGMPAAASVMTGIPTDEHLHLVAHSHEGAENSTNVQPGSHALNTAQIPLDTAVENASILGKSFWYEVKTYGEKLKYKNFNTINVKQIEITLNFPDNSGPNEKKFYLEIQKGKKSDYRLNENDMNSIRDDVKSWFKTVMNIDVS